MNADTRGCLEQISKALSEQVGPRKYRVWFKNSTRLRLDGEHLQVSVPNPFIGAWIERHFVADIAQAGLHVLGKAVQVHTVVDPALFGNLCQQQLDYQASDVSRQIGRASLPVRLDESEGNGNGNGNGSARRGGAYVASASHAGPRPGQAGGNGHRQALNPRFSLADFVVGPCNQLAYNCAREVLGSPGEKYNPLFIHGGCGLGKTHLLQGLAGALATSGRRWLYVPAEEFTNQFIWAMKSKKMDRFRARFRQAEVLLIDDVHFLSDKQATQSEFLYTFNELSSAGRQIVMASDSHPKLIGQLAEPLVNRFIAGMVAKIDKPDRATRRAILLRRAKALGLAVPDDVLDFIADHVQDNVRELEGALFKLLAYQSVGAGPLSLDRVRGMLADHISTVSPAVQLGDIESLVATYFGLRPADLHSSRKNRTIAAARSVAMYLARKFTDLSFPDIGKYMGNKNHATVLQACRRVERKLADDLALEWLTGDGRIDRPTREIIGRLEGELDNVGRRK